CIPYTPWFPLSPDICLTQRGDGPMLADSIKVKLETELEATHVQIVDNSWMHAGHAGAASGGSHLAILIVSPKFEGQGIMDQHRMVHQVLKEEMCGAIHALELKTLTPSAFAAVKS